MMQMPHLNKPFFKWLMIHALFIAAVMPFPFAGNPDAGDQAVAAMRSNGTEIYMDNKKVSFKRPVILIRGTMYADLPSLFSAFGLKVTAEVLQDPNPVVEPMATPTPTPTKTPVAAASVSPSPAASAEAGASPGLMQPTPEPTPEPVVTPQTTLAPDQTPEPTRKPFSPYVVSAQGSNEYRFEKNTAGVYVTSSDPASERFEEWDQAVQEINGVWYLPLRSFAEWQGMNVQRARFVDIVYLSSGLKRTLDRLIPQMDEWIYEGDLWAGKKQGLGQLYNNGSLVYDGQFENDLMQGNGKLYLSGRLVYEGNFLANYPEGTGKFYDRNGEVYEGFFSRGVKSGRGTLKLGTLVVYEGEWANDRMTGTGSLFDQNKSLIYTGGMKNNRRHGQGTVYAAGKVEYRGFWANGLRHGEGALFQKEDGKVRYDGSFAGGLPDGAGTQITYGKIPWVVVDIKGAPYTYKRDVIYWTQVQMRGGKVLSQDPRVLLYVGDVNTEGYPEGTGTFYVQSSEVGRDAKSLTNYRKVVDGTFQDGRLFGEANIYDETNESVKQEFAGESVWSLDLTVN